jgi:PAS domain S-box-containing protein
MTHTPLCSVTGTHVLGKPLREVWPEIYGELGALHEHILHGDRDSFFAEDHLWRIQRHGVPEDAHFTISYSPIPDPSSPRGIGGILATAFETTERVRNEKTLRLLTERLETEVQQRTLERDRIWTVSEDLLGVSNFEGYFLSVNPAWTTLLGWSEDETKSLHVSELRHSDDASAAIAGRARLAQGVQTVRMENRFRHRDGSWRWISWTMTADDGLIYVAGRHITAEKDAGEALRERDPGMPAPNASRATLPKKSSGDTSPSSIRPKTARVGCLTGRCRSPSPQADLRLRRGACGRMDRFSGRMWSLTQSMKSLGIW